MLVTGATTALVIGATVPLVTGVTGDPKVR